MLNGRSIQVEAAAALGVEIRQALEAAARDGQALGAVGAPPAVAASAGTLGPNFIADAAAMVAPAVVNLVVRFSQPWAAESFSSVPDMPAVNLHTKQTGGHENDLLSPMANSGQPTSLMRGPG